VMSNAELHAPESNGASAHTELIGDVRLQNSGGSSSRRSCWFGHLYTRRGTLYSLHHR
jgi:hypothetical protein